MVASEEELDTRDAAVLDALYDRDGDGLDAAQRSTLDDWRAVRGVVRHAREQGFDVEPPSAGTRGSMEMLMAAARAQAPAEPKGVWARLRSWLAPLVAHPAMAGAAALVVIGGAAGVLYLNGQSKVVRPEGAEQAAIAPQPPPALTVGVGGGALEEAQALEAKEDSDGAGRGKLVGSGVGQAGGMGSPTGNGAGSASIASTLTERKPGAAPRSAGGTKPAPEKPADTSRSAPVTAGNADDRVDKLGESGVDDETDEGESTSATADESVTAPTMAAPPPPPPVETTTVKPASRPAQIAVDDDAASQRASAVRLTTQARASAKAGDCARVNVLARQIESLDAAYYRDVFVRDPDIKKCR